MSWIKKITILKLLPLISIVFLIYPLNVLAKSESAQLEVRLIVLPPLSMDINMDMDASFKIVKENSPSNEYIQNGMLVTTEKDEEGLLVRFTKTEWE